MHDDGDVERDLLEDARQLLAEALQVLEHRGGLVGVPRLVPGGEGLGAALDPGQEAGLGRDGHGVRGDRLDLLRRTLELVV